MRGLFGNSTPQGVTLEKALVLCGRSSRPMLGASLKTTPGRGGKTRLCAYKRLVLAVTTSEMPLNQLLPLGRTLSLVTSSLVCSGLTVVELHHMVELRPSLPVNGPPPFQHSQDLTGLYEGVFKSKRIQAVWCQVRPSLKILVFNFYGKSGPLLPMTSSSTTMSSCGMPSKLLVSSGTSRSCWSGGTSNCLRSSTLGRCRRAFC